MHDQKPAEPFVQITGTVEDIDVLLGNENMAGARRCGLHAQTWIEMASITERQRDLAALHECHVHFVQSSPFSSGQRARVPPQTDRPAA
jgi:hypothetical protein